MDNETVQLSIKDVRVDTFRKGFMVNEADSAVRLTHIPTGISVACDRHRSQHKNRAHAMVELAKTIDGMGEPDYGTSKP